MSDEIENGTSGFQPINASPSSQADDEDYQVGYKKPPKSTRFKKGHSGNPKGRAKRPIVNDLRVLFDHILAEPHTIREGGRLRTTTTLEAIIHAYMNTGLKANPATIRRLFKWAQRIGMLKKADPSKDRPYQIRYPR